MSYTVWKFPLRWGLVFVDMPSWGKILHVGRDPASGYPAVWALVDPSAEMEKRSFLIVGTGHDVPKESLHVGTFIDDSLVWHIFETTESKLLAAMLGSFS